MRARNIKPAFFKDVELSECSFEARLLFQGYWCLADRLGLLVFSPKLIKAEVFPYDDVDVVTATNELLAAGRIVAYKHENVTIISVPNFLKHQRPHANEEGSKLPQRGENTILVTKVESASYQGNKRFALNPESLMLNPESPSLNPESLDTGASDFNPLDGEVRKFTPSASDKYCFIGKVIKLTRADRNKWDDAYKHINVIEHIAALDEHYAKLIETGKETPERMQKAWYVRTSNALAASNVRQKEFMGGGANI